MNATREHRIEELKRDYVYELWNPGVLSDFHMANISKSLICELGEAEAVAWIEQMEAHHARTTTNAI